MRFKNCGNFNGLFLQLEKWVLNIIFESSVNGNSTMPDYRMFLSIKFYTAVI